MYTGPDDGLVNPKHVAFTSEREYKLCSDWSLNLFPLFSLQTSLFPCFIRSLRCARKEWANLHLFRWHSFHTCCRLCYFVKRFLHFMYKKTRNGVGVFYRRKFYTIQPLFIQDINLLLLSNRLANPTKLSSWILAWIFRSVDLLIRTHVVGKSITIKRLQYNHIRYLCISQNKEWLLP